MGIRTTIEKSSSRSNFEEVRFYFEALLEPYKNTSLCLFKAFRPEHRKIRITFF